MFFFIHNTPELKEIKEILMVLDLPVRSRGIARPEEVVFFYDKNQQKGFRCNAHRFKEYEIPDFALLSPFLVSVGSRWSAKGLAAVVKSYRQFFNRGIPVLDSEMSDKQIIAICRNCLVLPWGGFPQNDESEQELLRWVKKAYPVFFPSEERFDNLKLTANQ